MLASRCRKLCRTDKVNTLICWYALTIAASKMATRRHIASIRSAAVVFASNQDGHKKASRTGGCDSPLVCLSDKETNRDQLISIRLGCASGTLVTVTCKTPLLSSATMLSGSTDSDKLKDLVTFP